MAFGKNEEAKEVSKITAKRNAQKVIVKKYLDENPAVLPANVQEAVKYLAGMGARSQGMQIANELKTMLLAGSVSAVDIFTKFGYGNPTMQKKIRDFIKAEASSRIWVQFADGNYSVAGKGENAPRGWTGFVPVVEESI